MPTIRISSETIVAAMQSDVTRTALAEHADKILDRAKRLASTIDEVKDAKLWRIDGIRPKGRPFSSVVCDDAEQEHGSMRTPKIRLLGRAAGLGGGIG